MGLIGAVFGALFGSGRNVVTETVEVFRPNAEAEAARTAAFQAAALAQLSSEFAHPRHGAFDRFVDGLNRLPRPAMALSVIFLLGSSMVDPVWFGSRMAGLALVPEPLWWLLGAIVSFYFGARHNSKTQDFQRSAAETAILAERLALAAPRAPLSPGAARDTGDRADPMPPHDDVAPDASAPGAANPALADWRAGRPGGA
ncbi:MAG: holin family protein [Rhodobacteraceae bacterium]|nr:holin family protein [Paracoccaceae bacterium]